VASKQVTEAWHERKPDLVREIVDTLREHFPNLNLFLEDGRAEIRGTFPVRAPDGRSLRDYRVAILLPSGYPRELPIVYEVGGRLPWTKERHVNEADGTACVLMPDERWKCFPENAPFLQYLTGPLHNFFLSQTVFEETGKWPFGEWSHGEHGFLEYCQEILGSDDPGIVRRYLVLLAKNNLKKHYDCPCGSGRRIRHCCEMRMLELRRRVSVRTAISALGELGKAPLPYRRSRLRDE
jgi:hypothetical protein